MMKAVVALSGGLDSAVLLARLLELKVEVVKTVNFRYNAKHNWSEHVAAWAVADHYKTSHMTVDVREVFQGFSSALLDPATPIPEGHYEEQSMRATVVPFRNGIFLSVLAGLAESLGADSVALGTHAGDHFIYPDCRPAFNAAMGNAIFYGTDKKVTLYAPFEDIDKREIVKLGILTKAPFHLTRTCYTNEIAACGRCGSCQERLAAFKANSFSDPIYYTTREILPKEVTV